MSSSLITNPIRRDNVFISSALGSRIEDSTVVFVAMTLLKKKMCVNEKEI